MRTEGRSTVLHAKAETFAFWLQIKPEVEPIAEHEQWLVADAYHWWVFEKDGRTWDSSLYQYLWAMEVDAPDLGMLTVIDCSE